MLSVPGGEQESDNVGFLENPSDWMFLAGIALLTLVALRKWYRQYGGAARRRRARKELREQQNKGQKIFKLDRGHSQRLLDAPPEMARWQVEMHDLARDLKAELDSKIAVLQQVTINARQEGDRLERLLSDLEKRISATNDH